MPAPEQGSILNVLMSSASDLDFTIDEEAGRAGYSSPNDLLLEGFDISRLLSVVAFALDYNTGAADRTVRSLI
jgi:hypothetical protein